MHTYEKVVDDIVISELSWRTVFGKYCIQVSEIIRRIILGKKVFDDEHE